MKKRVICIGVSLALAAGAISGCGKGEGTASGGVDTNLTLPLSGDVEVRYWTPLNNKVAASSSSMGDVACFKELEKRTGIKIQFQHPPVGQENEQFNLMIASKDLPDIAYYKWGSLPQSPQKYIEDGLIADLKPYLPNLASNYSKLLDGNKDIKREMLTDAGQIYMFPFLRADPSLRLYKGMQIRKDWLDKLKLSVPETLDDWYTVLKEFKEKDPNGNGVSDEIPIVSKQLASLEMLYWAEGAPIGFMQNEGKVMYGPIQPEFKKGVEYLHKLYQEGLIDPDFSLTDDKAQDAKVTSDVGGSYLGVLSGHMSKYISLMRPKNPDFSLVAAPSPIGSGGKRYNFNNQITQANNGYGAAVMASSKHLAETIKLFDYIYSDEGRLLMNFGIEGDSYTMEDGKPVYTEKILHDPDGKPVSDVLAKYSCAVMDQPMEQDPRYLPQMNIYPEQDHAVETWGKEIDTSRVLPKLMLTTEENATNAQIMGDISTYVEESVNKFIMGTIPMTEFDSFVAKIKGMNIAEAEKIQQAAYDRYITRNVD